MRSRASPPGRRLRTPAGDRRVRVPPVLVHQGRARSADGKTFLDELIRRCRTEVGYVLLRGVVAKEKGDFMESLFMGETLKYL